MLYLIDINNIKFIVYKINKIYIYFTLIYTKCIRIILLIPELIHIIIVFLYRNIKL